jgi:hypothetical protein
MSGQMVSRIVLSLTEAITMTRCPLLLYLTLPPLPAGISHEAFELYEAELRHPTGILRSLVVPPGYWEGFGLNGVAIADGCGWSFRIEGGTGLPVDQFWNMSVNCGYLCLTVLTLDASYATLAQLAVLLLLVRQMESTRTPSTLNKVSLWTIGCMGMADSWLFSAHVIIGIMSDNKTSLPLLVTAFLCLMTAVVFAPVRNDTGLADNSDMLFSFTVSKRRSE